MALVEQIFKMEMQRDFYNSIFNKLLKLPEETFLYPAHDYRGEKVSSIGKEKNNPRLQVDSVEQYIEIMNNLDLKTNFTRGQCCL